MIKQVTIPLLLVLFLGLSCKKETESEGNPLPADVSPYSSSELDFVPYTAGNRIFKKVPDFTQELTLTFKERIKNETFYAWDQTYFSMSVDPALEIELRLRYTQTENQSQKSLAIYMPYRDGEGEAHETLFELPIIPDGIETGFFSELITFHDTLDLFGNEWFSVFEVTPLTSNAGGGATGFSKVYYNSSYGLIEIDQKNGDKWLLYP